MRIQENRALILERSDDGYRVAKELCEYNKRKGVKHKMVETETTIIIEEHFEYNVTPEGGEDD